MPVIFILEVFPSTTEYFIQKEIEQLQLSGLEITICAVKKGRGKSYSDSRILLFRGSIIKGVRAHLSISTHAFYRYVNVLFSEFMNAETLWLKFKFLKTFNIAVNFLWQLNKEGLQPYHLHAHFLSFPTRIARVMSLLSLIEYSSSVHAHDIYTIPTKDLIERIKDSKFIVTCTKHNKKYLNKATLSQFQHKIFHVYHGIDFNEWPFSPPLYSSGKDVKILCVARLVEKKGIEYLFAAIEILLNCSFNIECTLIGDGPLRPDLELKVYEMGISKSVKFLNEVPHSDIKAFYYQSEFFVLPCVTAVDGDKDGIPNVLLEAMAAGIPVISTLESGIPELIIHNETGILVPPRDPQSIVEAIVNLKITPDLYKYLSCNARQFLEKNFAINRSTRMLRHLLSLNSI